MPSLGPRGSSRRPCAAFAEQRSALVDGALDHDDRERLLAHLVECAECRDEVGQLRRLRALLRSASPSDATGPVAARLISIAGDDADVPLWSRPFDRPAERRLPPSHRRARRRRAAGAAVALVTAGVTVVGAGWLAAPQAGAVITDPAADSTAEFSAALAQLPLGSREATAALATDLTALPRSTGPAVVPDAPADPEPLSPTAAADTLVRAVLADGQVNHHGIARVSLGDGDRRVSVDVEVVAQSGQGQQLTVRRTDGTLLKQGFLPSPAGSTRLPVSQGAQQLVQGLALSGVSGAVVAGRAASVVTADGAGGARRSWWVDDATGLLLWQAAYDGSGRVISSAGFTSVTLSDQPFLAHLAPRLSVSTTTASLTLGSAAGLVETGWFCAGRLDGLELVRVRTDSQTAPGVVQTVYTDGVSTISVIQQQGRLGPRPVGFTEHDGVWRRDTGGLRLVTWQAGDTVVTVATDGPADLLDSALAQLPPVQTSTDSRLDRVQAGWDRIATLVMG